MEKVYKLPTSLRNIPISLRSRLSTFSCTFSQFSSYGLVFNLFKTISNQQTNTKHRHLRAIHQSSVFNFRQASISD